MKARCAARFGYSLLGPSLGFLAALALSACSYAHEIGQFCEPPGTKREGPKGEAAVLHPLEVAPERLDDGWPVSTLAAEGLDTKPIGEMLRAIQDGEYTKVDSILIARNGRLILEAYFNGFGRSTKHNIKSAFKSVTSALLGIAIDKNLIADVNQPVSLFFPNYWPDIEDDRHTKRRITLGHLLTMTAGFSKEPGLDDAEDWYAFSLNQPMAGEPGTTYAYADANPMLIGGAIEHAAGQALPAFAKQHLFEPLGITNYCWTLTPKGRVMTDGSFYMRPRDMLTFGQVYLDSGVWRGRRVISESWVRESTSYYMEFARLAAERWQTRSQKDDAASNRLYPGWSMLNRRGYGYYWWNVGAPPGGNTRFDAYYANGDGGQKIVNFPNLDMVVVFTGSHYGKPIGAEQPWQLLHRYILPAVLDE